MDYILVSLQVLLAAVVGGVFAIVFPKPSILSIHPALMSLGMLVGVSQGLISVANFYVPMKPKARIGKKQWLTIHWVIMVVGVVLFCGGGLATVIIYKERHGEGHFETTHGIIGLVVLCFAALQLAGGSIVFLLRKWRAEASMMSQSHALLSKITTFMHRITGFIVLAAAAAATGYGLADSWQYPVPTSLTESIIVSIVGGIVILGIGGWILSQHWKAASLRAAAIAKRKQDDEEWEKHELIPKSEKERDSN